MRRDSRFFDPAADAALFDELEAVVLTRTSSAPIVRLPYHINDRGVRRRPWSKQFLSLRRMREPRAAGVTETQESALPESRSPCDE